MISEVIANLNKQREDAVKQVDFRTLLQRLYNQPDFNKAIMSEFCVNECARYAQASSDPALSMEARQDSLAIAQAAGCLRRWLSAQIQMGNQAEHNIAGIDAELERIRTEGEDEA